MYRWQARAVILLGGTIALLGCYIASYTTSLKVFLFLYCAVASTGYGIASLPHMICAWEWYPESKGKVGGLISAGYGFGNFIFAQTSTYLVNPKD